MAALTPQWKLSKDSLVVNFDGKDLEVVGFTRPEPMADKSNMTWLEGKFSFRSAESPAVIVDRMQGKLAVFSLRFGEGGRLDFAGVILNIQFQPMYKVHAYQYENLVSYRSIHKDHLATYADSPKYQTVQPKVAKVNDANYGVSPLRQAYNAEFQDFVRRLRQEEAKPKETAEQIIARNAERMHRNASEFDKIVEKIAPKEPPIERKRRVITDGRKL